MSITGTVSKAIATLLIAMAMVVGLVSLAAGPASAAVDIGTVTPTAPSGDPTGTGQFTTCNGENVATCSYESYLRVKQNGSWTKWSRTVTSAIPSGSPIRTHRTTSPGVYCPTGLANVNASYMTHTSIKLSSFVNHNVSGTFTAGGTLKKLVDLNATGNGQFTILALKTVTKSVDSGIASLKCTY